MRNAIIVLLATASVVQSPAFGQTVYYVAPVGSDEAAGTSWDEAYSTIAAAVAAAEPGDEVRVAEGTYSAFSDYRGLTLRGGYAFGQDVQDPDARPTIIDASGATYAAVSLRSGSALDGFTVRGGADGVRCFHGTGVTVSRNTISGAQSHGIYLYHTGASVTSNTIAETGMGIAAAGGSWGSISSNRIFGTDWGGIASDASSPEISANEIIGTHGIGILCQASSNPPVSRNLIYGGSGRGIVCVDSSPQITLNRVLGNTGGGISISNSNLLIAGNVIADNGRRGVFATDDSWVGSQAAARVLSNTIAGHREIGVTGVTAGALAGNILASNGRSYQGVFENTAYNCLFGNKLDAPDLEPGEHSVTADPLFVAPEYGNYHIGPSSPCRDAAGPPAADVPSSEIDGQPRVQFAAMDIGADESDGASVDFLPARLYVDANAVATGSGGSWNDALNKLSEAAVGAALVQGAEVWARGGTYHEEVTLFPYTRLYGGFAGSEEEIAERYLSATETIIHGGDRAADTVGATMLSGSLLNGVTIRDAAVGVVLGEAAASFSASRLLHNGYALDPFTAGWYRMDSCLIADNTAITSPNLSPTQPVIWNNVTVVDNGGSFPYQNLPISNCIIAYNAFSVRLPAGSVGNCVFGNAGSQYYPDGTLVEDPRFVDRAAGDYHLRADSPLRDKGLTEYSASVFDIDGEPRIQNRALDIGADEVASREATIGEARTLSPDESFSFPGLIAATASGEFPGVIHALQPDRTAGAALPDAGGVSRGDRIDIVGRLAFEDGQWRIDPDWDYTRSPGLPPLPWSARTDAVSTDRTGDGVRDAGPPTSGLLMKAAGRVTSVDWARHFYYLDDGAGMLDGTAGFAPHTGIRVDYRALTSPGPYSFATVTGIVQWEQLTLEAPGFVNGQYHAAGDTVTIHVLYPRDQADIMVHQQETGP